MTLIYAPPSASTLANTCTQILYHIVFSTKERATVLRENRREEFFRHVRGVHQGLNGHLHRIKYDDRYIA